MISMAFVRWTLAGLVLTGASGCLGGGGPEKTRDDAAPETQPKGQDSAGDEPKGAGVDASKLRIIEGKGWLDSDEGFVKIAGEVQNDTGHTITSVRVAIRLFDASGKELATDSITTGIAKDLGKEAVERVYTERTYIPAGESGVFYFLRDVKKIKGTYASHKLSVTARAADDAPVVRLTGFKSEGDSNGYFEVSGKIENTGSVGCRSPKGVFGLYGADGQLLGAVSDMPDAMFHKVLGQGQSVEVHRKAIKLWGQKIATIKGWADCEPPG